MRIGFRLFLMGALGVAACAATRGPAKAIESPSTPSTASPSKGPSTNPPRSRRPRTKMRRCCSCITSGRAAAAATRTTGTTWPSALGRRLLRPQLRLPRLRQQPQGQPGLLGSHQGTIQPRIHAPASNKNPPPDTIDHKDFDNRSNEYYPYLVNDVAAAKSYLDKHSSTGQANSSNLIVIGAGEGATIGAMWMESQWHLQKISGIDPKTGRPTLDAGRAGRGLRRMAGSQPQTRRARGAVRRPQVDGGRVRDQQGADGVHLRQGQRIGRDAGQDAVAFDREQGAPRQPELERGEDQEPAAVHRR